MLLNISGFFSIICSETRRLLKGFFTSYMWFILLVFISTYSLFAEKYADISIDRSLFVFKYINNPMTDVLLYIVSFAVTSSSDVMSGKVPTMVFPVSVGVVFFILFPFMLGLTFMSNQIMKKASTIIAGEAEKKTLHIMVQSPLTRPLIYSGKFIALLLLTLPMILFFYLITEWVFISLFDSVYNMSLLVLEVLFINAALFASAGMLISTLMKNEKRALWVGTKIVTISAALTSIWIMIPFFEFILNLTNNSTDYLIYIESLTWLSPFTLELMSVHDPAVFTGYFNILAAASVVLLASGTVTFIRKDMEY